MTLQKLITVTAEVATRRARVVLEILFRRFREVFHWLAFTVLVVSAAHIVEVIFLFALALQQSVLEANGTGAFLKNRYN